MQHFTSPETALNDLRKRGYSSDFSFDTFGLYCGDLDMRLDPEDFRVDEEYRFEGEIPPDEDTVVVAITYFNGIKGVLVDSYASYSVCPHFEHTKV